MTDETFDAADCVARILAGDDGAFRRLLDQTYPLVARIVGSHLSLAHDRAACEQETYLRAFQRLDQYRGDAPLEHWLARIAVNCCLDALRTGKRKHELHYSDLGERESAALNAALADDSATRSIEAAAAAELVTQVLETLEPEEAMLVRLHDLEEQTLAETAATLGWSLSWTKTKLARARGRVRGLLERLLGERDR
ncbi:MAG: RNA polymerase sigma factor [Planctomycetales bacterium]|nr:RNA polymerase sigma factor [Planctomycetales bacterium]MBN8625147.1 RNA polymerase sigma factor [Planctomycetota bacterium]